MKMFNLLFLILLMAGCNNKTKIEKQNLKIYFDGVFDKKTNVDFIFEDSLGIDTLFNITKEKSQKWQRLMFELPNNRIPDSFRISIGSKCKITMDKLVLNYNDDKIVIRDTAVLVYFKISGMNTKFSKNKDLMLIGNDSLKALFISKENLNSRLKNRYKLN